MSPFQLADVVTFRKVADAILEVVLLVVLLCIVFSGRAFAGHSPRPIRIDYKTGRQKRPAFVKSGKPMLAMFSLGCKLHNHLSQQKWSQKVANLFQKWPT